LSSQKKKLRATKAKRHMLRQQGLLTEESEEDDDEDKDDDGVDGDGDDGDDDDDDNMGERYAVALGLGKRPAEGVLGEPSSKRLRDGDGDPAQGTSGAAPESGSALDQPGTDSALVWAAPRNVGATPSRGAKLVMAAHPAASPAPTATLVTPPSARPSAGSGVGVDPSELFLSRSSR
jgi:hypothetical protein